MSRAAAERAGSPRSPSDEKDPPADRLIGPLRIAVGLSVAGRFLVPTEATLLGLTPGDAAADGWFSTLTLLTLAVWAGRAWQTGASLRWGRCEALVVGLVLAHGLAAVPVFWEGGERRAAAETVFNWAGLAASAALLRSLRRPGDGVRFAALAVACGTAAAVVGLYQVIVSLPATRTAYLELREQEENGPPDDRAEARAQLSAMGVPDDAAGRKRWEDRLLNSREPFGPYSLANTLAGVLLASVLLLPAVLSNTDRQGLIVGAAAAALLIGVLLLTKSRTGYVGLAVGGLLWAGLIWGRGAETRLKRRIVWGAGIAGGLLALGVGIAVGAGQLDREVISEAPRSLTFRMQYWTGTLRALAERPLLGTGPGNFRSFYLLHKEAAASESIAAPHSLPLDLWSSGGLLAPLFAAALAWSGVNRWRAASEQESAEPAGPPPLNTSGWDPLFTGVLAGFCLVGVFGGWLGSIPRTDAGVPPAFLALVVGWEAGGPILLGAIPAAGVLWWTALRLGRSPEAVTRPTGAAWAAATAGLAVHLLGADGAEFPAIVALFLLALAAAPIRRSAGGSVLGRRLEPVVCILSALIAVGGLWFILLPGREAGGLLKTAQIDVAAGRNPRGTLVQAIAADPLSETALTALADFSTARAIAAPRDEAARRRAIERWNEVIARRPRSIPARKRLSDLYRAAGDWDDAMDADRQEAALDPSAAAPLARLADSAERAGALPTARDAAAGALERDAITRDAGHADRVLPDETVARLRALIDRER